MSAEPLIFAEAARCRRCNRIVEIRRDKRFYVGVCGHVVAANKPGHHGTLTGYSTYGYRCEFCRLAKRAYEAARYAAS